MKQQSNFVAICFGLAVSLLAIGLLVAPSNAAPRLQTATATPILGTTTTPATGTTSTPLLAATATVTGTVSVTPTTGPSTLPTTGDDDASSTLLLLSILGIALLSGALFARLYMHNNANR